MLVFKCQKCMHFPEHFMVGEISSYQLKLESLLGCSLTDSHTAKV